MACILQASAFSTCTPGACTLSCCPVLEKRELDMEGILRVLGSQARVKGMKQEGERDFSAGLSGWDKVHHSDTSHLLKRFIRECREPPDIHRTAQ
ncbi:rho GTPase-activating protein 40 [Enhydra lutris kenyoni]|uniref:Rho GTPase-activating protein 40 n=1 Tax=Enhydra lutris kenyoni TaxID=391180 RepID=A0A2Y9IPC5_ENHLU|nr:rho GTPase-activating protein 40 [Enhydra lutris kenyoni]